MIGVAGAEGFDVQGSSPLAESGLCGVHISLGGKIKHGSQAVGRKRQDPAPGRRYDRA
jgi:hypothetical protein